jgi:hypothetical protein
MALIVPNKIETVESGAGTLSSGDTGLISREVELKWIVSEMDSYDKAETKGKELAPLYYDGHQRGAINCTPLGNGWYRISANYRNEGISDYEGWGVEGATATLVPNGVTVDTTGGSELITQSLETSKYPSEGENVAPDSFGAINVSGDQVHGIQKTIPTFNFTETWAVPSWYLLVGSRKGNVDKDDEQKPGPSDPYAKTLRNLTGQVNRYPFRIFDAGEVLFLGARYDITRSSTMVMVTYSFSVQPNRDDFKVGDITVKYKDGWDFLWVQYQDESSEGSAVKKPKYVYVDRIYERANFDDLLIGKDWNQHFIYSGDTFTHPLDDKKRNKS